MKVCHLYRTYFPDTQGGLEETIRQICLNTQTHGVTSRIFALSKDPTPNIVHRPEGTVYRAKQHAELASCGVSLSALKQFRDLVAESDIVHYHFPWPFADFLHFAAPVKKPTILTYHSDIVRQKFLGGVYKPLQNRFLKSVDQIVCTSPNYFATSSVLTQFEEKVDIVPIGLTPESYPAADETVQASTEAKYGRDFFLFVGVLRYYKGLHILLDAIKNAPYRVIIAGSGPTEAELAKQAAALALDNVIFAGQVTDEEKLALFDLSRGIVFPSYLRSEAFGVTLLEGAMRGKPLISTEVGSGTSHVNIDGDTGLVVAPGSAKALRTAMDQLYFRPDMAKLMGTRAKKRFENLFTGKLMGRRYYELYSQLMQDTKQDNNNDSNNSSHVAS